MSTPEKFDIDLGHGHWLRWTTWQPDLALNPKWAHLAHLIKTTPHTGAIIMHVPPLGYRGEGDLCEGCINFDLDLMRAGGWKQPMWKVEQWEPLTLSPSLLCHCGDHGFIQRGLWIPC